MDDARALRVGFVGAGAAGSALAVALHRAGVPVVAVASRRAERARALAARLPGAVVADTSQAVADASDLAFLTVPDDAIAAVCAAIAWRPGVAVVHASGAKGVEALAAASRAGAMVGTFHPLQALSGTPADADRLRGCAIGIEADERLRPTLVDLARRIGGWPLLVAGPDRPLYHAAAVLASNDLVALVAAAASLLGEVGLRRDEALRALLPLVEGAVANLRERGVPAALTGPIARGDLSTVEAHLRALAARRPDLVDVYRELGRLTVPLALERGGITAERAEALAAALAGERGRGSRDEETERAR